MTASNPIETALLADGRRIAEACTDHYLSDGVVKVKITLDAKSGRIEPTMNGVSTRISPGTAIVDDIWEHGGTFSLRRSDAFGGREIVFDDDGYAVAQR